MVHYLNIKKFNSEASHIKEGVERVNEENEANELLGQM